MFKTANKVQVTIYHGAWQTVKTVTENEQGEIINCVERQQWLPTGTKHVMNIAKTALRLEVPEHSGIPHNSAEEYHVKAIAADMAIPFHSYAIVR